MQFAASIHDAARRLEEAAAIFHFKSRAATTDYDELGGRWTDSRAQQFAVRHIQPQRESIDQGARLCLAHAQLIASAQSSADAAETDLTAFYTAQADFESAFSSGRTAAQSARDLASRANIDSSRVASEVQSLNGAISSASEDPGW